MSDDISRLKEQTCCALIPEYYDGVLEALSIQQINDAEIDPFVASIMRLFRNAYIQTADDDVISEYENELDISPVGTIQDRRQAVIDKINHDFICNDESLINIIHSIEGCEDVDFKADQELLSLDIYASNTDEVTTEQLLSALKEAMIYAPQNLLIRAIHKSNLSEIFKYYHASLQKEICDLGENSQESTHKILIYWGDDVQIPSHARLATPLKSRCWWIYGGNTWNTNNNHGKGGQYTPIYSDGSKTGKIPDEIKSAYSSTLSLIGEDYLILSGLCANTQSGSNASLTKGRIATYNGCIEVYSNPTITQTVNTTLTIFEFDISDYAYPLPYLPNEIYSINGNSIIWIDNGYLSNYFEDKLLQMEYYISERLVLDELLSHQFETIN